MPIWTGTINTDWNNAGNWSIDGLGNTGVPTSTTDAIFDATAVNPCVLGANRNCRDLTFTSFSLTLDLATFTLSAFRNITFQVNQSSLILGSTGALNSAASGTITSNGGTWPLNYRIANVAGITVTLADDMRVAGSYGDLTGGTRTINGNKLFVGVNVNIVASHLGTTNFIMNGTGTYSGNGRANLEIDTLGDVIVTGNVAFTRRFIVTAVGTLTMTAANVTIINTTTVDLGGRAINNLTHSFDIGFSTVTYSSDVVCNNFTIGNGTNTYNGPGRIFVNGNYAFNGASSGTLVVELTGSGTIGIGTMGLSCIINSSGTYTLGSTLTLGTNISLTCATPTLNTGTSTVTVNNGVTLSTPAINWNNITILNNVTLTINALLLINSILQLNGTTTFSGTHGFTCGIFSAQLAGSVLTFQNINANPLAEYRITNNLTIIGTALSRITLQSAGSATFVGTANGTTLTRASGTAPSIGMVVSQTTGTAPAGFAALFPNRPVINGGTDPNFTLDLNVTPSVGPISMRAGYKAVFILENNGVATQNVAYTTCQDIDSSLGQPILSFASNNDDQTTNVSLYRTINWGSLDPPPVQGRNYASVYVY